MLVGDALGRAMVELLGGVTTPPSGYAAWIAGPFSSSLSDPDPALDFDGGGLPTGIEWVVAGDPTNGGDDAGIAPTSDNTTDPDGKFLFVYRRTKAANDDPNTSITVEYGSTLAGWTPATHQGTGPNDITITAEAGGFGTNIDRVTVALPSALGVGGKLFARLVVAMP